MSTVGVTILIKRKSAADWIFEDPILMDGEMAFETDTQKIKFGDGTSAWTELPYATASGGDTDGLATVEQVEAVAEALDLLQDAFETLADEAVTSDAELTVSSPRPTRAGPVVWPVSKAPSIAEDDGTIVISLSAPPDNFGANDIYPPQTDLFTLTLTGNWTLASLLKGGEALVPADAGSKGTIVFVQDATGSRTVTLASTYTYVAGDTEQIGGSLPLRSGANERTIIEVLVLSEDEVVLKRP